MNADTTDDQLRGARAGVLPASPRGSRHREQPAPR